MSEREVELELQAKGKTYPRVIPERIDYQIAHEQYHIFHNKHTVCCLTLKNGFTVIGDSACVHPQNFDEAVGRKRAFERAREKIWQLEGYLLAQALHESAEPREGHCRL